MHYWGDNWFTKNGNDLYKAEEFISNYVYKWSRCRLISKEKYGTLRYEYIFPPYGSVRYGPHISLPFPLFYKKYEGGDTKFPIELWAWHQSWLYRKWSNLGRYILKRAVYKACEKWPNVSEEILDDLD